MANAAPTEVRCLYCGRSYLLGVEQCPHCGAPAHQRPQARVRRFRWLVALLALACLLLILWLPR